MLKKRSLLNWSRAQRSICDALGGAICGVRSIDGGPFPVHIDTESTIKQHMAGTFKSATPGPTKTCESAVSSIDPPAERVRVIGSCLSGV